MKRYWFLAILVMFLSACSVEVITTPTAKVVVTPTTQLVGPSGKATLSAALDNGATSEFNWEVPTGASFVTTAPNSIELTAPATSGTFTVKASSKSVNATVGEAQIVVDIIASGERKPVVATPTGSFPTPLVTGQIGASATNYFTLSLPADVAATGKAFYVDVFPPDADVPLRLTVFSADGKPYASSFSSRFFAPGETAFTASQALAPAAINPEVSSNCAGSCVIQPSKEGTVYVKIVNPLTTPVNYQLFAFVSNFADQGEDANDSASTPINLTTSEIGAIEELNDVDYYKVGIAGRTLRFTTASAASDLALQAVVIRGTERFPLNNNQILAVQLNDVIEVKSTNNRAANYQLKTYTLELQ